MDVIHLLPDSVANQIAAGEVIQRPASCLKELVENALDAGATTIRVHVRDAGKTLVQVIDNGSGMSASDARMAFERHATSKISKADDLFTLQTMGFRGEALPSICAVAQVKMTTRRAEDEMGTLLEINGSQVEKQEFCQCAVGTNIQVTNLFFNVPARRRFLKSDQTELRNLITTFQHIVLVYPQIAFTFVADDEIIYDLSTGTTKQRIEQVFGKSKNKMYTAQLLEINQQTELVTISGFVGKPEAAGKQAQQFFFVNGRYMRHPYFHKAVLQAYTGMLDADHLPPYFIYFTIRPEQIDVNVHPTKTEIKFADEQSIYPILSASIRAALGKFNVVPSIDFLGGNIDMPIPNAHQPQQAQMPHLQMTSGYNPFKRPEVSHNWQDLYAGVQQKVEPQQHEMDIDTTPLNELNGQQVFRAVDCNGYIACAVGDKMLLVHARRAHVNILYHELLGMLSHEHGTGQQLLFPESITLSKEEEIVFASMQSDLEHLGFIFEKIDAQTIDITAVPAMLAGQNAESSLRQLITEASSTVGEDLRKQIALGLARTAAIPSGKRLTDDERNDLLRRLFNLALPRITPDGKTVIREMDAEAMAKLF